MIYRSISEGFPAFAAVFYSGAFESASKFGVKLLTFCNQVLLKLLSTAFALSVSATSSIWTSALGHTLLQVCYSLTNLERVVKEATSLPIQKMKLRCILLKTEKCMVHLTEVACLGASQKESVKCSRLSLRTIKLN